MPRLCSALLAPACVALIAAGPTQSSAPSASAPQDVVVQGVVPLDKNAPVRVQEDYRTTYGRHLIREQSELFARCAKNLDVGLVRAAIDSPLNTPKSYYALGKLLASDLGCYPGLKPPGLHDAKEQDLMALGSCNPRRVNDLLVDCRAPFDRAAILEAALHRFAPNLALSQQDTGNPAVRARFNAREVALNQYRLQPDFLYFEIAVCLVRLQPDLATRIFQTEPGSRSDRQLEAAILVQGRRCVGNKPKVKYDPSELRLYLMDAFYRWGVAARGVTTLISG